MKRGIDDSSENESNNSNQTMTQSNTQSSSSPLSNSSTTSLNTNNLANTPQSYSPIGAQQVPITQLYNPVTGTFLTIPVNTIQNCPEQINLIASQLNNSNNYSNSNSNIHNNSNHNLNLNNQSSSTTQKPEAKKVKIQKSQPSKVVHIRNIPQQITEIEVIQFGLIFGNIINVLNLRSKCQAFLEFEKCEEAQSMINYFANNPISVAGRQIFVQYSNYKNLVTDPTNTNNQVAKAALDLAKELHKAAQSGGQNTVLRAMIQNMLYAVSLDTIYQIFNRFGPVLKIITFTKNDKFQALIQMKDASSAQAAKNTLHGQNIYNSCCTLHIDYSKLNTLNVKYNNEKSRDYTNPLLPAGDCPDHLALGPGGVIPSIQLSMAAAAAAAAAGYATTPFALPPGYHLATPTTAPFLIAGKYMPQQAILTSAGPTLLQPTTNLAALQSQAQNATLLSTQNQNTITNSATAAAATTTTTTSSSSTSSPHIIAHPSITYQQGTLTNLQNQNATSTQCQQIQIQQHHHHHHNQHQQQQQQQTGANLPTGPILLPLLQNINEDAYIMMYQA